MIPSSASRPVVSFDVFEVDLRSAELRKPGSTIRLQDKSFQILAFLLEHPGELVTRDEIQKRLWPNGIVVDFEHSINTAVNRLRQALGDEAEHPRFIETLPRLGYRFIAPVNGGMGAGAPTVAPVSPPAVAVAAMSPSPGETAVTDRRSPVGAVREPPLRKRWKALLTTALILVTAAIGRTLYFRLHQTPAPLTDKDTIVLADFDNKTGDSVFDDTLKQGLSVQLEQSPFLALVSDRRVNETLKLMGRQTGDRLTPEVTREVCERTGSTTMLTGSIVGLGSQYVIGLKAVSCHTGDVLAEAQEQAAGKEAVLKALDAAAASLRSKLGESLGSVQKYATPVEEATTPSLEALKAYSVGLKTRNTQGDTPALPFFRRAVELDPNIAMAYAYMSADYFSLNEGGRGAGYARKAYELREKVSERERFQIEWRYYLGATGELEKAAQTDELWQQVYPRDDGAYKGLGFISAVLGNWEKALEEFREALRLEPNGAGSYVNLGIACTALNRLGEAEAVQKQAEERKLEGEFLLQSRYWLAFLKGDVAQVA